MLNRHTVAQLYVRQLGSRRWVSEVEALDWHLLARMLHYGPSCASSVFFDDFTCHFLVASYTVESWYKELTNLFLNCEAFRWTSAITWTATLFSFSESTVCCISKITRCIDFSSSTTRWFPPKFCTEAAFCGDFGLIPCFRALLTSFVFVKSKSEVGAVRVDAIQNMFIPLQGNSGAICRDYGEHCFHRTCHRWHQLSSHHITFFFP